MNKMEQVAEVYVRTLDEATETMAKAKEGALALLIASLTTQAIDTLMDTECPHCHKLLETPSLEDIQEWLKERK